MTNRQACEEELSKAFEMMWGKFPEPVMLIHRDRTIIAANECCQSLGGAPGTKCNAVQPERHKGCKANEALDNNETRSISYNMGETEVISYWMPVSGVADYFVHFGIGTAEAMKAFQASAEQGK